MKIWRVCILLILVVACNSSKHLSQELSSLENEFQHHLGFTLYDVASDEIVYDKNGAKYFTPASNTKILTLYVGLNVIHDSIPALYYVEKEDSLIFWGSGDPTFLYQELPQSNVFSELAKTKKELFFSTSNFKDKHFGPGWSWDDYLYTFSSEKSPFPIYGNVLTVRKYKDSPYLSIEQPFFKQYFLLGDTLAKSQITRDIGSNNITYNPSKADTFKREAPFRPGAYTVANLLADTLHRSVTWIKAPLHKTHKTWYSIPTDSAYKEMMQQSDNFIAEQLLLVASGIISDTLKAEIAIKWAQDKLLKDSPQPITWEDGSGLSRYNLITPNSLIWLWKQLYEQIGQKRLFSLLATGGESGTLKNYYIQNPPYVFGKTGTLSNNHNLSGFLVTQSGKLFIFSFMNNNYPTKSRPVKKKMEQLLEYIYLNY